MQENAVELYSDRFIPSRRESRLEAGFAVLDEALAQQRGRGSPTGMVGGEGAADSGASQPLLNMLLRSELLGLDTSPSPQRGRPDGGSGAGSGAEYAWSGGGSGGGGGGGAQAPPVSLFRFKSPIDTMVEDPRSIYDLSPVGHQNRRLLMNSGKAKRKIPKSPFKVLDAPALCDDFYLNLVDW